MDEPPPKTAPKSSASPALLSRSKWRTADDVQVAYPFSVSQENRRTGGWSL